MKSICEYIEEDKKKWESLPYIAVKKDGQFVSRTFGEVMEDVQCLARALISEGVRGNVMLYSQNSCEWAVADLAVLGYVGVFVPIDSEWTAFDISNTLSVIEINTVLYERSKRSVIEELRKKYPAIRFICIEESFPKLIKDGKNAAPLIGKRDINETAMILFTSGTTNRPKAIPLTQKNLLHNWNALYARTPMTSADISYIFLPLNHVYAGVANFLYTIISGMSIYLCSDRSKMLEEMLESDWLSDVLGDTPDDSLHSTAYSQQNLRGGGRASYGNAEKYPFFILRRQLYRPENQKILYR